MKKLISAVLSAVLSVSLVLAVPLNACAADSGSSTGLIATTTDPLSVRSSPSTSSSKLSSLPKSSLVTLISQSGSWWKVEYQNGQYGYCYASYIQPVSGSYAAFVNASYLNVRSGGGIGYSIQTALPRNTGIIVLSQSNGWSRILYSGTKTGYVDSRYLTTEKTTTSYPAIQLNVSDYKQTDSRWSSVPIGTTGQTIKTVGCLTTAVSMAESYRTGTSITPDKMASKLTYSASGTMYWPSNYSFSTDSSYLQSIYTLLKSGKPVLFGAKSVYGQHWVVITGYTGGDTLTASNFIIHDPGTYTRTNLLQLLNQYPTFYKIAYYQ